MFIKTLTLFLITVTTLFAEPQAVVFDFGGVMTGQSDREAVVVFLRETFQLSEEEFSIVNARKKEALKNGMKDVEFWENYALEHGITLPADWAAEFKAMTKKAINPSPEMYELVNKLKESFIQVGLLSNIDARLASFIREFDLYEPFNPCILSCEIGVEKPDPKAFEIMLQALNRPAEEVIFIDDKLINVEAAKSLGIDAILFESPKQIEQELESRLSTNLLQPL